MKTFVVFQIDHRRSGKIGIGSGLLHAESDIERQIQGRGKDRPDPDRGQGRFQRDVL